MIVEPSGQDAFTIFAQDSGRTGYVSGTLAVREGLEAWRGDVESPFEVLEDLEDEDD